MSSRLDEKERLTVSTVRHAVVDRERGGREKSLGDWQRVQREYGECRERRKGERAGGGVSQLVDAERKTIGARAASLSLAYLAFQFRLQYCDHIAARATKSRTSCPSLASFERERTAPRAELPRCLESYRERRHGPLGKSSDSCLTACSPVKATLPSSKMRSVE